jgi:hypothetical protein
MPCCDNVSVKTEPMPIVENESPPDKFAEFLEEDPSRDWFEGILKYSCKDIQKNSIDATPILGVQRHGATPWWPAL